MFIKNRKGQFLVVSLLVTFITLITFIVLYPIIKSRIDTAIIGMDVYSATLLELTPFFILLSIILSIIWASLPTREG